MEFGMFGSQNSIILYISVNTDRTGPFLYFKSIYFLIYGYIYMGVFI